MNFSVENINYVEIENENALKSLKDQLDCFEIFIIEKDLENMFLKVSFDIQSQSEGKTSIVYLTKNSFKKMIEKYKNNEIKDLLKSTGLDYNIIPKIMRKPTQLIVQLYLTKEEFERIRQIHPAIKNCYIDSVGLKYKFISPGEVLVVENSIIRNEEELKTLVAQREEEINQLKLELFSFIRPNKNQVFGNPQDISDEVTGLKHQNKLLHDIVRRMKHSLLNERNNHAKAREALESLCDELKSKS